jgi:tetratricopeptide (TPR) repeat protein
VEYAYYRKALDVDPNFARTLAALSHTYSLDDFRQFPSDVDDPLEESIRLAEKAIAMDDSLSVSHWAAGYAYVHDGQLEKARAAFTKALVLKPNNPDAMAMLGTIYVAIALTNTAVG